MENYTAGYTQMPQWTIGPITLGSQQSWPVSAQTITGGWSGPVTQLTQHLTPVFTPVFGGVAGGGMAPQGTFPTLTQTPPWTGGGAAPQWTIGPITLGSQQSWPVTPQTITPGGGGGGGGTFTPFTPQTLTPVTPQVTPHTFTPVTPQVTPHTLTPVTPGTFTPIAGGAGAAPQWTIGPITLGSQQSWPVSQQTITGGWSSPVTPVTQVSLHVTPVLTPIF